ncbi:MAG TPA: hypothetical protein VMN78_06200 [Longimicrobiales bacterium]|nr:hypothetical protein [Longimicrobiales bacterium]
MRSKTTKRVWMAAVGLALLGALGACGDQPMGPEEGYEVQLDGASDSTDNCIIIEGQVYCNG